MKQKRLEHFFLCRKTIEKKGRSRCSSSWHHKQAWTSWIITRMSNSKKHIKNPKMSKWRDEWQLAEMKLRTGILTMHIVWHSQLILHDKHYELPLNALLARCKIFLLFVYQCHLREKLIATDVSCSRMPAFHESVSTSVDGIQNAKREF